MRPIGWKRFLVVAVVVTVSGCKAPTADTGAAKTPAASLAPVGTIKQVMKGIVDPSSALLWNAVSSESTDKGVIEKAPQTDEDWATIEHGALTLAEAAGLLVTPGRHVALAEEANTKTKEDAPELTPAQIEQKIAADPSLWSQHAQKLQETAVKALNAARKHDKDGLVDVGEDIDNACESCHQIYWYPDDKSQK